jgi:hypothetical protein
MKIICTTNLDLRGEQWPDELPSVPRVGDRIQSATRWKRSSGYFQLELQVVSVTWKKGLEWVPVIELHMTDFQRRLECRRKSDGCDCCTGSITAFYEWYAPLVGKSVGSFI